MFSVLYVDDESGLLDIGKMFLEEMGQFSVDTSTSALKALPALQEKNYDAIISDYQMPEMDGIAFLKALRNNGNQIPFILFTGRGREEVVIEAINNGADFYLQKGGNPTAQFAELAHKIRLAVDRRRIARALAESEEKYRSLLDLAPLGVIVHQNGRIVYANSESVRLAGAVRTEDLIGRDMLPLIHPDDRIISQEHFRLLAQGKTIPLTEMRLFTLDGRPFSVAAAGKPIIYEGTPSVLVVYQDVTDRKKQEDELRAAYEQIAASEEELRGQYEELAQSEQRIRESEEKFRNIIVNAPYGMHFYDLKPDRGLVFTGANPGADRILGISHEPFVGKNIEEAFPGLEATEVPTRYREAAESGTVWQTEQVNYDQGAISGAYAVTAFQTAPGTMAAMFVDITGRKRTEKMLKESEKRSRKILEQAPLPFALVRDDGVVSFVNDRFVKVFGYSREEIPTLQAWWEKAYPDPDYRKQVRLQWEEALRHSGREGTDIRQAEYRVTCRNGDERIMEISGLTISDGFLAIFIDQTGRRHAEETLAASERRYRSVLENIHAAVVVHNPDTSIRLINTTALDLLGLTRDEAIGRVAPDPAWHFSREDGSILPLAEFPVSQVIRTGKPLRDMLNGIFRPRSHDTVWVLVNADPEFDEKGSLAAVLVTFTDITGRRRAEEALRQVSRD